MLVQFQRAPGAAQHLELALCSSLTSSAEPTNPDQTFCRLESLPAITHPSDLSSWRHLSDQTQFA